MSIHWFLCGNERVASSRIHGIRVHEKLLQAGYDSHIVFKPHRYLTDIYLHTWAINVVASAVKSGDVVIIQKLHGKKTVSLAAKVKAKGARVVFIDCDLPAKKEIASQADLLISPSTALNRIYEKVGFKNIVRIQDSVEQFLPPVFNGGQKKTVVWFGTSGLKKWDATTWFRSEILPAIKDTWNFVTVSDHKDATYRWSQQTAPAQINQADLVVIPIPDKEGDAVKSANRCTQSLALGVPVLCHSLTSYREVIVDNHNGLVSDSNEQWISFIRKLEDEAHLRQMKNNAFDSAQSFSLDIIVNDWISHLRLEKSDRSPQVILTAIREAYTFYLKIRRTVGNTKKAILSNE
jgi:glycosyltransferase involved in cell wall biosynthesis